MCRRKNREQNAFNSLSERQWQADLGQADLVEQRDGWSHLERRLIAALTDYLAKCINLTVEIAALELLMEPEEAEVCLRYTLKHAKRRGSGIFEIFDTEEKRTILWQAGGVGWSTKERG